MSRKLHTGGAINEAIAIAMRTDPDVILMGEDVAGGGDRSKDGTEEMGGVLGTTRGLVGEFGMNRVRDTPIAEMGLIGTAVGAAATGLRPIAELMFMDFLGTSLDPLLNQASKLRYMFGGKVKVPLTVRTVCGAGMQAAAQHSQSLYWMTTGIPGLKTVIPSSPAEAKGLLLASIRDDDPVIFCEAKGILNMVEEVPEGDYEIPLGQARVVRDGSDISLVAFGSTLKIALAAAEALENAGTSAEVVDLRTLSPLDEGAILSSLEKTGRMVIIDESTPRCSVARDVAALCVDRGFDSLQAPVKCVTAPHTPVPFSRVLEQAFLPSAQDVLDAVGEMD
ncbi:MAG: alpha-ketoacid dehydrogenase subunit beta [Myxococcota bacterium]|jgi:acetoin:2,6-dichlorophenolindophenol oxidoreductase subunit beta|nr:alpha-ketoacid dehydrogenase subunit beta [Myxococcota bacterium]